MLRFWRVKSVTFSIIRRILGYVSNRNIFCNSPQSSNRNRRRMGATQKRSPFFLTSMCKKKRTSTRERGGLNELEAVMSVHTGTVSSSLNCAIMQACLACSLLSEFRPQLNPKISGGHSISYCGSASVVGGGRFRWSVAFSTHLPSCFRANCAFKCLLFVQVPFG